MYVKLALGNARKSARDYAVYFVTITLGVAVFYAFNTIGEQSSFLSLSHSQVLEFIGLVVHNFTYVLAVIMGLLMVYANNFLIRRRKKELGLYQVLGMSRGQVSLVITLETLLASIGSLAVGLALGVFFSQLLVFVTAALFNDAISNFKFVFSISAALLTLECFAAIFVVMLLFNLRSLRKVNLSELMSASRHNEQIKVKNLPLTIVLAFVGIALIVISYVRLTHDGLPVFSGQEYQTFSITTAMVSVGTLVFFYGLSGILLHLGRASKAFYLRDVNMFTLRQLASRINTVGISMGVITMLLFLAVAISASGFAICAMLNNNLSMSAPYDASISLYTEYGDTPASKADIIDKSENVLALLDQKMPELAKLSKERAVLRIYDSTEVPGGDALQYSALSQASGVTLPPSIAAMVSEGYNPRLDVVPLSDYNNMRALLGEEPIELGSNSYALASNFGDASINFLTKFQQQQVTITLSGTALTQSNIPLESGKAAQFDNSNVTDNTGTIIVPDAVVSTLVPHYLRVNVMYNGNTQASDKTISSYDTGISTSIYSGDDRANIALMEIYTKTNAAQDAAGISGMAAYLAIYIGLILIISCAAILAIQQLTAASDAQPNFRILSQIGVSRSMQFSSLRRQIAVAYFFPLVVALLHVAVALNEVLKVFSVLGKGNLELYVLVSVGVFVLVYLVYYGMTYATARGIIASSSRLVRE